MASLMSACSQVGCLELAKWVDSFMSTSSIDLRRASSCICSSFRQNAKCGNMERATILFEEMPKRDLISYCSMIQGLSINGHGVQAVSLFDRMLNEGLIPDDVAFTVILTACSRAGLVEEGCRYFDSMIHDYCLVPSPDHFACIVDLLGRSENVKAAYELIKSMPVEPHTGAVVHFADYVLLSNIHAAADWWLDVSLLRNGMNERGIRKIPGCSWL